MIVFEKDIGKSLGISESQLEDVKENIDDVKEEIPEVNITTKMYKIFIICLVSLGMIVSVFLFYKSYKLEKNKEDLVKLIVANFYFNKLWGINYNNIKIIYYIIYLKNISFNYIIT